jgi:F-type H+-transporting ATPase subunit beta
MDDLKVLVIAAQQGDKAAFNQVVLRFQDMAYATAYALLHDAVLAQDAAQEALIDAYLSLPHLREPAAFPGWFRRIVIKHADRQTRGRRVATYALEQIYDLRSPLPTPALALEQALLCEDVHAVINLLPQAQRLVTLLFYMEGYSQQEIADYLEVPLTAVKKRLFNARQNLKERMLYMVQDVVQSNRPSRDEQFAGKVAFFIAVKSNDFPQIKLLLKRDPSLVRAVTEAGMAPQGFYWPVGNTALHWAAAVDNQALLELLLTHGADINSQPKAGQPTPLHEAVHMGRLLVVDRLLAQGANPNLTAYRDQTPLHLAVHRNASTLAQKLIAGGAEVNRKDGFGRTPLAWALLYGRTAIADLLTAAGAPPSVSRQAVATPVTAAQPRCVPVGSHVLGRLLDSEGHPLDRAGTLDAALTLPIHRPATSTQPPIFTTGIKIIDLLAPLKRGGQNALLSPMSGLGRMVLLSQLVYSMHTLHNGYTICLGLERRGYTAQDMLLYWRDNGADPQLVSERIVNVFARSHDEALPAAETGLTIAEAFRAEGKEVLLLVDAELAMREGVTAYLKANTAATPTSAITTLYWGDYTVGYEPTPLAGLDTALALERWRAEQALHPAIDPLRSRSVLVETGVVGDEHGRLVAELKRRFVRYAELDRILERLGEDALATLDDPCALQDARRVRRVHRFLTQPLPGLEFFTGLPGVHVSLADTLQGCRSILAGEVDELPEEAFYMTGTLAQVQEKAQKM